MVGPPDVATRIKASIAACHSWAAPKRTPTAALEEGAFPKGDLLHTMRVRTLAPTRLRSALGAAC
jgi:hypothetical protein